MSEVDLGKGIKVFISDRKLMKASRAWRIFFDLPPVKEFPLLAPVLSGMIDNKVKMVIRSGDITLEVDPMYIFDVPTKGRKFQLVMETCYEWQNSKDNFGPKLTMILHNDAILELHRTLGVVPHATGLTPPPAIEAPEGRSGTISDERLKGLHILFNNPKFQEYVGELYLEAFETTIELDKEGVKVAFKRLCDVDSCRDLDEDQVKFFMDGFNGWLNPNREDLSNGGRTR